MIGCKTNSNVPRETIMCEKFNEQRRQQPTVQGKYDKAASKLTILMDIQRAGDTDKPMFTHESDDQLSRSSQDDYDYG